MNMKTAIFTAVLVFTAEVGPSWGSRMKTAEMVMNSGDAVEMGGGTAQEVIGEDSAWCNPLSKQKTKLYHFELMFPTGVHYAMQLTREPNKAKLVLGENLTWSVAKLADGGLNWDMITTEGNPPPADAIKEMDLIEDVAYIRREQNQDDSGDELPDEVDIVTKDGHQFSFSGGLYYSSSVMLKGLDSEADLTRIDMPEIGEDALKAESAESKTRIWKSTVRGANLGLKVAVTGSGVAVATGVTVALGSMATLVATGMTGAGFVFLVATLGTYAVITYMPLIVGAGAVTLGVAGLGLGSVKSLFSKLKTKRELTLTASQKFFSKMRCHNMMKKCEAGPGIDILVPDEAACPDLTED